ncbi:MAG: homocysteine S-methyltransferase family protein [Oscillospiraceae bacterium]|jgi:5-methyltetrahydrofolate--homocysteine methyltransferase|nr:homocysteine S-methyltransferase family protein [Oscillospiraceae bacterium]
MLTTDLFVRGVAFFDGGMGTLLQAMGLPAGGRPELWNVQYPERIIRLHRDYLRAGAQILKTNTFGANVLKYPDGGDMPLRDVVLAGIANAKQAIAQENLAERAYVALDMGPTGKLLEPYGDLAFEDAAALYTQVAALGAQNGADLILIETMTDLLEAKAAVLGAKSGAPHLPIFVTLTFEDTGHLLTGTPPGAAVVTLEGLGVSAIGVNCGAGPQRAREVLPELVRYAHVPVIVNPNAGLPHTENGVTVFDLSPQDFAAQCETLYTLGASVLGGCCGTTPAHIAALRDLLQGRASRAPINPHIPIVSSARRVIEINGKPILIGERINPTGKPKLQQALRGGNYDYIQDEAMEQADAGAHVLDVNVGLPDIDEAACMAEAIAAVSQATVLPLQIDSANPRVLAAALRQYNGKPLVNSVNGKKSNMAAVFPLVKQYGGVVVALLLDENGIPATVEGRIAIAEKIYATAAQYGLGVHDILIDALTLTISAEPDSAHVTLETVRQIKERFGGWTILGVSNISFGLPKRELINASFFTLALESGLSAAIVNPKSEPMMSAYHAHLLLHKQDENAKQYIAYTSNLPDQNVSAAQTQKKKLNNDDSTTLIGAILLGRSGEAEHLARVMLADTPPLGIIQRQVVPALDEVGVRYADGRMFLPQLLQSANAAKAALAVLQASIRATGETTESPGKIVLATVEGDIHDIGKNIVKTLFETYRFDVIDLGKDVKVQAIVDAVAADDAVLCGLSALMTTTVPSMEATIQALRTRAPDCKILVGGAVLTQSSADAIGADAYCPDAMSGIRAALRFLGK